MGFWPMSDAFAPDLESMLRDKMLKILLQQYLPGGDITAIVSRGKSRASWARAL
jgi:hypothetical protein